MRQASQLTFQICDRRVPAGHPFGEIDVEHVFVERRRIAADSDQQPSLGRLAHDGVKRSGTTLVAVVERRARSSD